MASYIAVLSSSGIALIWDVLEFTSSYLTGCRDERGTPSKSTLWFSGSGTVVRVAGTGGVRCVKMAGDDS